MAAVFRTSNRYFRSFCQQKQLFLRNICDSALLTQYVTVYAKEAGRCARCNVLNNKLKCSFVYRDDKLRREAQNLDCLDEYDLERIRVLQEVLLRKTF